MAVPKKRRSKANSRVKKAHWRLEVPNLRPCPNCGFETLSHRACVQCGTYKGRQVIQFKEKKVEKTEG